MFSRRRKLRQAALHYAAHGWPVAPAIGFVPAWWRGSGMLQCACRAAERCDQPGVHPTSADWSQYATTDTATIYRWWSAGTPNVLLAPGTTFDVWVAPPAVGATATALLERDLLSVPTMHAADASRLFFTRPAAPGASLSHVGISRLSTGDYVPAPPSWHGGWRRDKWSLSPDVGALPSWERVALLLLEAAGVHSTGCSDEPIAA